jgi:hypothetical protein
LVVMRRPRQRSISERGFGGAKRVRGLSSLMEPERTTLSFLSAYVCLARAGYVRRKARPLTTLRFRIAPASGNPPHWVVLNRDWYKTGLTEVVEAPIVLSFEYADFNDYWTSFSTGPSRIAQRLVPPIAEA